MKKRIVLGGDGAEGFSFGVCGGCGEGVGKSMDELPLNSRCPLIFQ